MLVSKHCLHHQLTIKHFLMVCVLDAQILQNIYLNLIKKMVTLNLSPTSLSNNNQRVLSRIKNSCATLLRTKKRSLNLIHHAPCFNQLSVLRLSLFAFFDRWVNVSLVSLSVKLVLKQYDTSHSFQHCKKETCLSAAEIETKQTISKVLPNHNALDNILQPSTQAA